MQRRLLHTNKPAQRRRGAMLVFVAFLLLIFIGIVAFSVDVAYMHLSRTQLQTATDAAARSAGETLSRTQDIDASRQAAKDIAAANIVDGGPLILDDSDILDGNSAKQSNGKWQFTAGATPVNGFRITGRKTDGSPSGSVNLIFGPMFGKHYYELSRSAASVRMDRDICLVVDRSSSMKLWVTESDPFMSTSDWRFCLPPQPQSRWEALKDAIQVFMTTLKSTPQKEFVALATYASNYNNCGVANAQASLDQGLTDNAGLINAAMHGRSAMAFNGGTNIAAGVDVARAMLNDTSQSRPFARKTIVLMTDGQQQGGRSPQDAAQDAKNEGIIIYTVTFGGEELDQSQMQAVASITGGKHYHAPDAETLNNAFREIALSLSVILTE